MTRFPLDSDAELLYVDLDGTLLPTDSLDELLVALLSRRPWFALALPYWIALGRARLKAELVRHCHVDVTNWPINQEVLSLITARRERGHRIVLATGAPIAVAEQIGRRFPLFHEVLASTEAHNLTSRRKAEKILSHAAGRSFDYVGNASADLPIWRHARRVLIVGGSRRLHRRISKLGKSAQIVSGSSRPSFRPLLRALRPHQWTKNLLLFLPALLAHRWRDPLAMGRSTIAFVVFCLAASAVYLVNDLVDLNNDRMHVSKRFRPFASGEARPFIGVLVAAVLFASGFGLASALPPSFATWLILYMFASSIYSFYLKRIVMLDVMLLAGLYAIRLAAGAKATMIQISPWLLGFALFLFLAFALAKRTSELVGLRQRGGDGAGGRDYGIGDLDAITAFGAAASNAATVIFALYVQSPETARLYSRPYWLWGICALLLYWQGRLWLFARRGVLSEDPVVFAIGDPISLLCALSAGLLVLLAI